MSKPDDKEKYFDPKEYHTITVGLETSKEAGRKSVDLMATLLKDPNDADTKKLYFDKLKKDANAVQQLIDALQIPQLEKYRITLLTFCWESGADFSKHFIFFIDLVITSDFNTSFEAFTVIENLEGVVADVELTTSKVKINAALSGANAEKTPLLKQMTEYLNTL